jgi:hypothetical protein
MKGGNPAKIALGTAGVAGYATLLSIACDTPQKSFHGWAVARKNDLLHLAVAIRAAASGLLL